MELCQGLDSAGMKEKKPTILLVAKAGGAVPRVPLLCQCLKSDVDPLESLAGDLGHRSCCGGKEVGTDAGSELCREDVEEPSDVLCGSSGGKGEGRHGKLASLDGRLVGLEDSETRSLEVGSSI